MSYAIPFAAYTPPARSTRWDAVEIEEATDRTGAGATLIDTLPLTPVDTDPRNPQQRTFTTENATLAAGWYRVTWTAIDGDRAPTRWVYNGHNIAPSLPEVARLVVSRLRDAAGAIDHFPDTGRTSRVNVEGWILDGIRRVRNRVGVVSEDQADDARHVVALYAAMLIELAVASEQQGSDSGTYDRLKGLFGEALKDLLQTVAEVGAGGEPGPADDAVTPIGSFPCSPGFDQMEF